MKFLEIFKFVTGTRGKGLLSSLLWIKTMCLLLSYMTVESAYGSDSYAYWIMPGINYQISPKHYCFTQLGWNPQQRLFLAYGNFVIRYRPNLDLNLGFMYIDVERLEIKEWTLMNGLTTRIPAGNFLIENRSLIWNRFRSNGENLHFFRNRVRLLLPLKSKLKITPYLFDEVSYSFNRSNIERNRLGAGCTLIVRNHVLVDISYARQNDKISGNLNLFFIMVTTQLSRKKRH